MGTDATDTIRTPREQRALAILRVALGAMLVWVFFENLVAANARVAAPLQAATELGFGVFLLAGTPTWGVDALLSRRYPGWRLG